MGRKAALMPWRLGRPKEMLEAPQVVLTPSSSRRRRTRAKTCRPAVAMAPIGMTSGSTTMSWAGMPKSAARWTILRATSKRTSGSSEMPVSSLEMATTGTSYFLIEREDELEALLLAGDGVDERAAVGGLEAGLERAGDAELSIESGRSTRPWIELDHLPHQRRLGLVGVGVGVVDDAGVDVEHGGAAGGLLQRVRLDGGEVAGLELGGELLAAGGVDALADDAEGLVEADEDGPRGGCDDGAGGVRVMRRGSGAGRGGSRGAGR